MPVSALSTPVVIDRAVAALPAHQRRELPVAEHRLDHAAANLPDADDRGDVEHVPAIRRAVGVVEIGIVRIDDRRPGDFRRRRIRHALRQRVVGEDAEVVLQAALCRQQQAMINAAAGIVDVSDRAVELPLHRILQDQPAALVGVAGRRARRKDRRVELRRPPQVRRLVAEIGRRQHPVAELPLRADVPLLQRRRVDVHRRIHVDAERRERLRCPPGVERRERIAARIGRVRDRPSRPAGFDNVICAPQGGLFANRVLKNRCGVSKNTPQPARMLVLPSPPGVQIAPRRGANCAILPCVVPRPG